MKIVKNVHLHNKLVTQTGCDRCRKCILLGHPFSMLVISALRVRVGHQDAGLPELEECECAREKDECVCALTLKHRGRGMEGEEVRSRSFPNRTRLGVWGLPEGRERKRRR